MHNKSRIKNFLILIMLMAAPHCLNGADTIKIHLTYKHKLNDNNQTQGRITVSQKFYTPDDTLFREIRYNEQTGQISGYTFYFYHDNLLTSEECYRADDRLLYALKHVYDSHGNKTETRTLNFTEEASANENRVWKYNSDNLPVKEKIYRYDKVVAHVKYKYNDAGLLMEEIWKFKKNYDTTIRSEIREFKYSTDNRIEQILINGKDDSKTPFARNLKYEYDDQGRIEAILSFDGTGAREAQKTYRYLQSGALSIYQEQDGEGRILQLLQYEYRKHFMETGIQQSAL